ncbi:dickkopf-related protein 3-like [Protopterus annectens]|uniref:dickkopf-related protein 3-like n=1 Tax=Protopterus annectens TaxID=7888 RepID=UPI001CFAA254|nr:dickkopf-related protein 3-like [Protopterus annectens]
MTSRCLPCRTQEMNCTRNEECCQGLCVWGQCAKDVRKGQNGTICENQGDCSKGTCCAIQSSLLYPVCTPLATEGKRCHDSLSQNELLDLIWEFDPDSALDYCPCADGLKCQARWGNLFLTCERPPNKGKGQGNKI